MKLSGNRALAFVGYLQNHGGVDESLLTVDWKGEDWSGLRREVATSSLIDKGSYNLPLSTDIRISPHEKSVAGAEWRNYLPDVTEGLLSAFTS